MKVLLAEDDRFIREGLEEILRNEGYRVLQAEDGEQDEQPEHLVHAVLLELPRRSGPEK